MEVKLRALSFTKQEKKFWRKRKTPGSALFGQMK